MSPIIKLSLTDDEDYALQEMAAKVRLSKQDYLRWKVFGKRPHPIFEPKEAVRRALEKYTEKDPPFSLPDIYGEEWLELEWRMTGAFGRRFFNYVCKILEIEFAGMTPDRRRATYRIKKQ